MVAIGIDIGGTKIAIAAVGSQGEVLASVRFATEPNLGFKTALSKMISGINHVISDGVLKGEMLDGIGIGCAGPVDPARGTIHNPHTLPTWDDCDLVSPLAERFAVPVRMENDADAAASGEARFGAGRGSDPMVMLTFGTGIGFAAIVKGQIYRGVAGEHPEAGHIPTIADGPECYCGLRGCFEAMASGTAIDAAGKVSGFADGRAVFAAAAAGDSLASGILDVAVNSTATAIWTLAHTFLPQRFVLGGGLIDDHFELFAAHARTALSRAVLLPKGRVEVVRASLGNDAGVVGAASLVMKTGNIG
ncbi:MAG: ROK family protein [Planctomycetales bacterium]|nr:ROK family protein [Planctomycetales bacterium]